jgi:hypothetical protein
MNNKYTGKLIDAMLQVDLKPDLDLILNNNTEWVDKFCVFYRGSFDQDIASDNVILGTTKRNDQRYDITPEYLNQVLSEIEQHNCRFIGELMLSHADKVNGDINPNLERYINSESPNLLSLISQVNVPIMIHWETYNKQRDLGSIEGMLRNNSTKTFIWSHCGFADPDLIDYMFLNHQNLFGTLSKLELIRTSESWISSSNEDLGGYNVVNKDYLSELNTGLLETNGNIKPEWKSLLEKHSNRFMFATDSHKEHRREKYNTIVNIWRNILGEFELSIAEQIAYRNAMNIYGIAPWN